MTQAITDDNFGAWVLKCNPATWDLQAYRDAGNDRIETWSVQDNYRSARMGVGDPVVFWVTGSESASITPGIWGVGVVAAPVEVEAELPAEDDDEGSDDYWLDADAALRARFFVTVDLPLFDKPISRQQLLATPELKDTELLRQPQMSNPSWLTQSEWSALAALLPEDALDAPPPEVLSVWQADAVTQQPDPITRALIEARAVELVRQDLTDHGWEIEDVQSRNLGWDLTARRDSTTRRIEVKGRGTRTAQFLLTANEHRAATTEPGWEVALVTNALTEPALKYVPADAVIAAAAVVTYKIDLTAAGQSVLSA